MSSLYLIAVANGLVAPAVAAVQNEGAWIAAFRTFDISIVVVAAAAVAFRLASRVSPLPFDKVDGLALIIVSIGLLVPLSGAAWTSLTMLAIYESFRMRNSSESVAAATLFIGIAASQYWGRLFLETFSGPLLTADATLVTSLLHFAPVGNVERLGNIIEIENGQPLAIMIACSSLSNVSSGLLCWLTLVRAYRPEWRRTDVAWAVVVVLSVIALNVLRMALMGFSRQSYLFFHGSVGAEVFNALVLLAAASAAWPVIASVVPQSPRSVMPCAVLDADNLAEGGALRLPRELG